MNQWMLPSAQIDELCPNLHVTELSNLTYLLIKYFIHHPWKFVEDFLSYLIYWLLYSLLLLVDKMIDFNILDWCILGKSMVHSDKRDVISAISTKQTPQPEACCYLSNTINEVLFIQAHVVFMIRMQIYDCAVA